MKPKKNEIKIEVYEEARIERDNKRICIIACVVLACGSLMMYKNSNRMVWGLILILSVAAGIYLLSRLAELDDFLKEEDSEVKHGYHGGSKETLEDEAFDIDDEYDYTDEESLRHFNINMPLFKKEAKEKYDNLVKEMGMTDDCRGDGVMDLWSNIDGLFGINKWEFFDKEISEYGGKYTDMIIQGNSGRCVDFSEIRIPVNEFERIGLSSYLVEEMVKYNKDLEDEKRKEKVDELLKDGSRYGRRSTDRKVDVADDLAQFVQYLNDTLNEKNKKS